MLYVVNGWFKTNEDTAPEALDAAMNEHLGQRLFGVRLFGALTDDSGRRVGLMGIVEADTLQEARAFLAESPYTEAGLYQTVEAYQYQLEVGRLI
jgi:uncharacterized protein YciI